MERDHEPGEPVLRRDGRATAERRSATIEKNRTMMWIRLAMVLSACVLMGLTLLREDSHSGKEKEAVAHTKDAIRHIEEFVKGTGDAHA